MEGTRRVAQGMGYCPPSPVGPASILSVFLGGSEGNWPFPLLSLACCEEEGALPAWVTAPSSAGSLCSPEDVALQRGAVEAAEP